jgi:hypothetical protein
VIFFSSRDATPWAREFLHHRVRDPAWTLAFSDSYATIFVRSAGTTGSRIAARDPTQ